MKHQTERVQYFPVPLHGVTGIITMLSLAMFMFFQVGSAFSQEERNSQKFQRVEQQFRTLPMDARRLTGPLFWLHGTESEEKLRHYVQKIAESGNGSFTAESRPHKDWLGPGWYRDLGISLDAARTHNLKMWIFDEKWWPSGEVGGNVPRKYTSRKLELEKTSVRTGRIQVQVPEEQFVAVLAGKRNGKGIIGESLVNLTDRVDSGTLSWNVPEENWTLLTFTWTPGTNYRGTYQVDGLRPEAVEWYLQTVYQPHFDHFPDAHGNTIPGYFYDEPATPGDWGPAVRKELNRRGVDWKDAIVAWTDQLADPERQVAMKYQFQDAKAEAWGRTLYGGLTEWAHEHEVRSIGHFLEHNHEYLDMGKCAGNMFQLQKYSDMGGIDLVIDQMYPGERPDGIYQTPKLASSISHVYDAPNDLAMVEIFGGYHQDLTYPQMKWLTDQMQVRGVNFMITHAFNPKSPYDTDHPPYFYNSGHEPRFPLYRVWANYTNRLSTLLTGGRHVAPVAFLFVGNSYHVGDAQTPERMTSALQDALLDSDWVPYDAFEEKMTLDGETLHLNEEKYRVLVVPSAEVIPYGTLKKAVRFFRNGGVVVGYGQLPEASATSGKTSKDITRLRRAIWGKTPSKGTSVKRTSSEGGRSYYLPETPSPDQVHETLVEDAGVHPTMEVIDGETNDWLHVLHRRKRGHDLFFITNQNTGGGERSFRLKFHANGTPELWDPMRGTIRSVSHEPVREGVTTLSVDLAPMESKVVVFQRNERDLPSRITEETPTVHDAVPVMEKTFKSDDHRAPNKKEKRAELVPGSDLSLEGCSWMWHPDERTGAPAGATRYFRTNVRIPVNRTITGATIRLTADNRAKLYVNGQQVSDDSRNMQSWKTPSSLEIARHLRPGSNVLAVRVKNTGEESNPAGLIGRFRVTLENGDAISRCINEQWESSKHPGAGWKTGGGSDTNWTQAAEVAPYGDDPWGTISANLTLSPVESDPFEGIGRIPEEVNLDDVRAVLDMKQIEPESAARVFVNGKHAGGVIGQPLRLGITSELKPGKNRIRIVPFSPSRVRIQFYPGE